MVVPLLLFVWACGAGPQSTASAESGNYVTQLVSTSDSSCVQDRKTAQAPGAFLKKTNPLEATESNLRAGWALFHKSAKPITCKTCHGATGNGQGDADFESTPPARNFTCKAMMDALPDGQLFWIIKNGSKNTSMLAFSGLKDQEVWQLILYIRSLSKP